MTMDWVVVCGLGWQSTFRVEVGGESSLSQSELAREGQRLKSTLARMAEWFVRGPVSGAGSRGNRG